MPRSAQLSAQLDEALARYGVAGAAVRDIRTGRVNTHWRIEAQGGTYALRRYRPQRSDAAILFEHDVLRHLDRRGWPVASPLPSCDGHTVVSIRGYSFSLFPFLSGQPPPQSERYARIKGGLLARLHQDFASWDAAGQRHGFGRAWELDLYVAANCDHATLNELLRAFGEAYPDLARTFRAQKYTMLRELSTLGYGELPVVPCHFDFHRDNLLFQRGELTGLLDFDLAHLDSRVADIASSIFLDCYAPPAYKEISPRLAGQFVAGYVEGVPLADAELQLVVPLVRAAILGLVVWRLTCWARDEDRKTALQSLHRSGLERFPSFERGRSQLEVAVLQAAGR